MKRNLRFYFALFFAKGTAMVMKLIGRKGTSMPGSWAIILCPDFLDRIEKPETVIGITGTNGKTTVSNMVDDVLEDCGYEFTGNRSGTNVNTGVASSLIADSTFFGKPKKKLAVFELDERSSPKILPYIKPDILMCTNIFRDSYKRNAHMEFIINILNSSIPKETKLILNGDDMLCSSLKSGHESKYFGIDRLPGEDDSRKNIVCDVQSCPKCGGKLDWEFVRYHHIGRAVCESCGYHNPRADYDVTHLDRENKVMTVMTPVGEREFPLLSSNPINVYNSLSAVSFLMEFGIEPERIVKAMGKMSIRESRYAEETFEGRHIIMNLAKGQNPVACSRAFENARNTPGKKSILLYLDDRFDASNTVENISWFYDTDFEFLNHPDIIQVVASGARHCDSYVRLLMAGVPEEKIVHVKDAAEAGSKLNTKDVDSVVILYDIYNIKEAEQIRDGVKQRISEQMREGGI